MTEYMGSLSSPGSSVKQNYTKYDTPADSSGADVSLAGAITKEASKQTYYTIRLLADRPLTEQAYQAYAYFRWVDDIVDQDQITTAEALAFLERQQDIIDRCYEGIWPSDLCPEEDMIAELIQSDRDLQSGLHMYIKQMMTVMTFDVERRGRLISQDELDKYAHNLAVAVTEALHYFIGHDCYAPHGEIRYHAVTAAHITHMLRDAIEDAETGYYNIPLEYLYAHGISPTDVDTPAFQDWVKSRIKLARDLFASGRTAIAQVENLRCRAAGYAYIARFEIVLDAIEKDNYLLRAAYPERKSKRATLRMATAVLSQIIQPGPQISIEPAVSILKVT